MNIHKINKTQHNGNKKKFILTQLTMLAPPCCESPNISQDTSAKEDRRTTDLWVNEGASNSLFIIYLQELRVILLFFLNLSYC